MKSFLKSKSFWVTVVNTVGLAVAALTGVVPPAAAGILAAAGVCARQIGKALEEKPPESK